MRMSFIIVTLMLATQLTAQVQIGEKKAYLTAEQFLTQNLKQEDFSISLSEEIKSETSEQTNLFVFSVKPQGFVIVSAMNEILAYSLSSSLPASEILPIHISYWLKLYNKRTDYLIEHPEKLKRPTKQQDEMRPLLTSIWGQGCYHNSFCPESSGPCGHVSAGCVAIAMAQIMYYHKYPQTGYGASSYYCPNFWTLSANYGQTNYQWEEMADTLHENNPAVAQLVYHCGVSVEMQYGAHLSLASNTKATNALQQFFAYPTSTHTKRLKHTDEEWLAMIKEDLNNLCPVYYAGVSDLGGHAFVCDGYDSNGLFHFNFGWDGVADGYYTLDDPSGFSESQAIIHNIVPLDVLPIQCDEHNIIYVAPDGEGDGSSWDNATNKLQLAIFKAHDGNISIWVKEGIYNGDSSENYAFRLLHSCNLFGGFKGDEPSDYNLSLRDIEGRPSILDGGNTQGVVKVLTNFSNDTILIDGFTIQNGKSSLGGGILANGNIFVKNCLISNNYSKTNGGGFSQTPGPNPGLTIIENCKFVGNEAKKHGGGIYDCGNATYKSCQFCNNYAKQDGGGIYCTSFAEKSLFSSCTISNNTAKDGGGISTNEQGAMFWNCLINNNTAESGGGGYINGATNLFNCTIAKNEAASNYGGVCISQPSSQRQLMNCIIWGNVTQGEHAQIWPPESHSFCAVEDDPSEDSSNFKTESDNDGNSPRFYVRFNNPTIVAGNAGQGSDFRLQPNSLCINRGTIITELPDTDLDGNPRCQHAAIDFGAYESNTLTHFIDAYLCEEDPYYQQDSLLSEIGTYTFLYQELNHDSLVIINMQQPPPTIFLDEDICEGETYDFLGDLLGESGQYLGTEQCITYRLNLTVKQNDTIQFQQEICEGETYDFFGQPLYESGSYIARDGCTSYLLDLDVNPWSNITMKEDICEGESFNFFGTPLYSSGVYSKAIDCKAYLLDLTVNPLPPLQCSHDTIVEYGNLVQLKASGADSYLWSTGDTTSCITIYPYVNKTYSVTGFSKNGCNSEASINVWVFDKADEIVLYPNPADDKVEIYIPLIDEVNVFNLMGVQLDHVEANRQAVDLNVSRYLNGTYIIQIKQMKNNYFKKLIIVH